MHYLLSYDTPPLLLFTKVTGYYVTIYVMLGCSWNPRYKCVRDLQDIELNFQSEK